MPTFTLLTSHTTVDHDLDRDRAGGGTMIRSIVRSCIYFRYPYSDEG